MKWIAALVLLAGALFVLLRFPGGGDPESRATREPRPTALSAVASERVPVDEGATIRAAPSTAEHSESWVALNNRATKLLGAGDLEGALQLFERCVTADPSHTIFSANLAETLTRLAQDDHARHAIREALEKLARAQQLVPERSDLATLRERWRIELELEANHWSEGSDLFELSFDAGRDELLHNSQAVLDHLERAYEDLRLWFGVDPVRELGRDRIRVVLYRAEEFDRLTGLGDWAGGVFDGVVRVAVDELLAQESRWSRILTHELVHAFLFEIGGGEVPGWLNEGLAQLLESAAPDIEGARRRMGSMPFPLERLRASLAGWNDSGEIARAYAQSLAFVALLRREYGDEALRQMVSQRGAGVPVAQSFERWTSVPLEFAFQSLVR